MKFSSITSLDMKKEKSKTIKKAWPTKDAMEQVYELNLWGGGSASFYSGDGSYNAAFVEPYLDAVINFFKSFETPLVVCDLGCGDFNVGKELVEYSSKYIGVDIVEDLINRNRELFYDEKLEFQCLDVALDDLPKGDCVILRQVLQHLSNEEVLRVVQKLDAFKYVILTEHLPFGDFEPNKDIISGQGIRIKKQSGIDLVQAPFNLKSKSIRELSSVELEGKKGRILTSIYQIQ